MNCSIYNSREKFGTLVHGLFTRFCQFIRCYDCQNSEGFTMWICCHRSSSRSSPTRSSKLFNCSPNLGYTLWKRFHTATHRFELTLANFINLYQQQVCRAPEGDRPLGIGIIVLEAPTWRAYEQCRGTFWGNEGAHAYPYVEQLIYNDFHRRDRLKRY